MEAEKQLTNITDAELIDRVQRGDVQAYGLLVERYERAVLAIVLPALRDIHAAQDVVQDVFVHCYGKIGAMRDRSRFGYWLLKVARRQAIRASRRRQRETSALMRLSTKTDRDPSPLFDDEKQNLLRCVQQLPAHERLIVMLKYFQGQSVQEIAKTTGRPIGTVTKQLSRAIERLRGELIAEE